MIETNKYGFHCDIQILSFSKAGDINAKFEISRSGREPFDLISGEIMRILLSDVAICNPVTVGHVIDVIAASDRIQNLKSRFSISHQVDSDMLLSYEGAHIKHITELTIILEFCVHDYINEIANPDLDISQGLRLCRNRGCQYMTNADIFELQGISLPLSQKRIISPSISASYVALP